VPIIPPVTYADSIAADIVIEYQYKCINLSVGTLRTMMDGVLDEVEP